MSISSETRKAGPYTGNGVTTALPFFFKVFSSSDVRVVRANLSGTESDLVLTTDYTVSLNADQDSNPGGTVNLVTPAATDYLTTITSAIENLQPVVLTNAGGFYPSVINTALDRLTIMVQQLAESVSRSLKTAISTPSGVSTELPAPVPYQILGWNAAGDAIQNTDAIGASALAGDLAASSGSSLIGYLPAGTGAVSTDVQSKLRESVSVFDFMTAAQIADVKAGTALLDVTAAIQAAIDAVISLGRGEIFIPPGTYRTTSTITLYGLSISIKGAAGEFSTILKGDFIGGAILEVQNRRNSLSNLQIDSSTTRISAGGTADIGIFVNPGDSGSNRVTHCKFENLFILNQPSHGFAHVGASWDCLYSRVMSQRNGGHGFVFDNGESFGYVSNLQLPGICRMEFCEGADNEGHGLIVGNDSSVANRGLRLIAESCDFYRNAEAAGVRKAATDIWVFGELCQIRSCGINGLNQAGSTRVNAAAYIYGKNNVLRDCRLIDVDPSAVVIGGPIYGYSADGNAILANHVIDSLGGMALNPVVSIDAAALNTTVDFYNTDEIQGALTLTANNASRNVVKTVYQLSDQIVNNSTTIVSSPDLKISMLAYQRATFKAHLFFTGDAAADIRFAILYPAGATCYYGPTNNILLNSTDAISAGNVQTTGGIVTLGTAGATLRSVELSGFIQTAGTSGDITVRFAQLAAVAADTTLKANSSLTLTS